MTNPKHETRQKGDAKVQGHAAAAPVKVKHAGKYVRWAKQSHRDAHGAVTESAPDKKAGDGAALRVTSVRPFPPDVNEWRVEVWEKGGDKPLATFTGVGTYNGQFTAKSFEAHRPQGVPEKGYDVHVRVDVDAIPGAIKGPTYVPLKGHAGAPNESWELVLKVYADGALVPDEDEHDVAHVWVDWPTGAILYPMLGAPAIVTSDDKYLEVLVATKTPIPVGAEKFYVESQLRMFEWDPDHELPKLEAACKKRTFTLYKGASDEQLRVTHYSFEQIGSDVDEGEKGTNLFVGMMQHYSRAQSENDTDPFYKRREKLAKVSVFIPVFGEAVLAGSIHLYKVRIKLTEGSGLYDLAWMNKADMERAAEVVKTKKGVVVLTQDKELVRALFALCKSHSIPADDDDFSKLEYKHDHADQGAWKATTNHHKDPGYVSLIRSHHPVSVIGKSRSDALKVGHLTDIHLDVRMDTMSMNPVEILPKEHVAGATLPVRELMVNYNAIFTDLAKEVTTDADILCLTGDLIDCARGFSTKSPAEEVSKEYAWRVGAKDSFAQYYYARNWVLFYQVLKLLYRNKKPVFTILGNHDYRENPYSLYSSLTEWVPFNGYFDVHFVPYQTVPGDMNLTAYEGAAIYGPDYYSNIGANKASLETAYETPKWYDFAINCWKDYQLKFGDKSLLFMDWDQEEDCMEASGKIFHLPRSKRFMTEAQTEIFDRWVAHGDLKTRIMLSHTTLACNNAKLDVTNKRARAGIELAKVPWGSMGHSKNRSAYDDSSAKTLREKVAGLVSSGKISLTLSGHSHMDGIYKVLDSARVRMQGSAYQGFGKELAFTDAEVKSCAVVTNSGGPLGEFIDWYWTRRSRPAGSVFTVDGGSIRHKHVPSKRPNARPRRCVLDSEVGRIIGKKFVVESILYTLDERPGQCQMRFDYLVDPEAPIKDPINDVAEVIVAIDTGAGWTTHAAPAQKVLLFRSDTLNDRYGNKEKLAYFRFFLPYETVLECKQRSRAPGGARSYFILRYNAEPRDNWVIEVRYDKSMIDLSMGRVDEGDAFAMVDAPKFDEGNARWRAVQPDF